MTSKDDFLNSEFLKQFKNSKEFTSFMEVVYVSGTEEFIHVNPVDTTNVLLNVVSNSHNCSRRNS